jgi:hypothetical protein
MEADQRQWLRQIITVPDVTIETETENENENENEVITLLVRHHDHLLGAGNLPMILGMMTAVATTTGTNVQEERGDGSQIEGQQIAGMTGLG